MSKTLKILSWNVNGIRSVVKKDAFRWVDEAQPDILGLQEIKATPADIPENLFEKTYPTVTVNSGSRKGYSGVMCFCDLPVEHTDQGTHIDTADEGRIIEYRFHNIAFFNIYFPNGQQSQERLEYKMGFYDRFLEYIEGLRKEGLGIIFMGDINTAHKEIDLKNPKQNEGISGFLPIERAWIDKVLERGYADTFRHVHGDIEGAYSWWTYRFGARARNAGWRIDYVFISPDLLPHLKDAFILKDIMGPDHCPVGIELEL